MNDIPVASPGQSKVSGSLLVPSHLLLYFRGKVDNINMEHKLGTQQAFNNGSYPECYFVILCLWPASLPGPLSERGTRTKAKAVRKQVPPWKHEGQTNSC